MTDWVKLDATVTVNNSIIRVSTLKIKKNIEPILAKLQSVGELCLFGLGAGAVRHEEVLRLKISSSQWHNSYLYYWSESWKQGSMQRNSSPKLVEHRLSLTISKVFFLIRHVMTFSQSDNCENLISCFPGASMLCLLRDIYDLDYAPHMLNAPRG